MRITSVRSFLLSYPFPEPVRLPFYGGERTLLKRDALFIRVEADNGLVGYAPGPGSESVHRAIGRTIAPFLEGRADGRLLPGRLPAGTATVRGDHAADLEN